MKANRTATQTILAAGLALCAMSALSNSAQAQGAGSRRVFRPQTSRSAAASTNGYVPGQAGYNPNMTGTGANSSANVNGTGAGANGMGGMGAGGNRGGNGQQTPLVAGTITAGEASTGRIQIQSQANGNSQILQVTNATRFVTQTAITTSDLQTGEWVQIKGTASNATAGSASITASTITAGQLPAYLQQEGRGQGMGGNEPGMGGNSPSAGNTASVASRAASGRTAATQTNSATSNSTTAMLAGIVTSVSPLVVTLHNGTAVTVKTASDAQINRVTPLLFRNLQVGDQLKATGMAISNSAFVLTDVAINM